MAPQSWLPTQWSMASSWTEGRRRWSGSSLEEGIDLYPGRKTPLYESREISVCVVSPYVRMMAVVTDPFSSEIFLGAWTETASWSTAWLYTAATLSTSKATSLTASPCFSRCAYISFSRLLSSDDMGSSPSRQEYDLIGEVRTNLILPLATTCDAMYRLPVSRPLYAIV